MVKLLEVAIDGPFEFGVVVDVHMGQFGVLTVLGIKLHKLVQLQHRIWVLIDANVAILVFGQVNLDHSDHVVIVEDGVLEVF